MQSMTGYGRGRRSVDGLIVDVEMKSVNHKYFDVNIRLPKYLNFLEQNIKKRIQRKLSRGRIDVFINVDAFGLEETEVYADLKLGKTVYDSLYEAWKTFDQVADFKDSFQVADLMTIPNFLNYTIKEPDENVLQETTLLALSDALESITKMRCNEGEALYSDLSHQLEKLEEINKCIEKRAPVVLEEYSKKLFKKVEEWTGTLETEYKTRLGMEIVLYSDKSDINEEISRLFSHINQFKETMEYAGAIGKRLDFLCQEMNREMNTMGSKSNDVEITNYVISGKTTIEKIREQVQNIE